MAALTVRRVGYFASVQDRGRPGFSDMGLGRAGAADRGAAALANRMLGNSPDAAVIESVLGSIELLTDATVLVVVTGTSGPVTVIRGSARDNRGHDRSGDRGHDRGHDRQAAPRGPRGAAVNEVIALEPGDALVVDTADRGLRSYIGVRGGIDTEVVLASRSRDTLAALGPPPLATGDLLPVGDLACGWPLVDAVAPPLPLLPGEPTELIAIPGPRDAWFDDDWRSTLEGQTYLVAEDTDRVGMRLTGSTPLRRRVRSELPSEGVEVGSLQVPAEGFPVVFLADHPVTGGYPVVAVLRPESVDRAAQLRPGDTVRFRLAGF